MAVTHNAANPIYLFIVWSSKIAVLSALISYGVKYLRPTSLPPFVAHHVFLLSFATIFVLGSIDQIFLYPKFRSPLRHLPTIKGRELGALVVESPRGASPLRWMRQFPTAEMILVYAPLKIPIVVLSGANALRDVLNTRPYDFEKTWGPRGFLARVIGFGLILSEGNEHRKQKKVLNPAFNIKRVRALYSLMWEKTLILNDELLREAKELSGVVEMSEWGSRLTLDIIGPTSLGRDFQSLTHKENRIAEAFLELLNPTPARMAFLGLHFIFPPWLMALLPISINRILEREVGYLRDTCNEIISEKKGLMLQGKELQETDILARIIQTGEFSDHEIADQMLTFLAAGHETTASAFTWTCYLCAKYPAVQQKLRAEIRQYIPSSTHPITYDLLESMPYLNGVCEETQRLYPTVPATIREAIVDTIVDGVPIKKGTNFVLVPYAVNRHPKFWGSNAEELVPERWIDELPDGSSRPNKHGGASTNFAEITFLHGPRACMGRDFAKAELRCAVAGVLGKFQMELTSSEEPKVMGVVTTKPADGMHLKLTPLDDW